VVKIYVLAGSLAKAAKHVKENPHWHHEAHEGHEGYTALGRNLIFLREQNIEHSTFNIQPGLFRR